MRSRNRGERFTKRQIVGLILLAVSSFFILCLFNSFGNFGKAVNNFFIGVFGYTFYAFVFGVFCSCLFLMLDKKVVIGKSLIIKIVVMLIILIAIFHFVSTRNILGKNYAEYIGNTYKFASSAGGVIFSVFLYIPLRYFGYVASVIIFSFLLVIFSALFTFNKMQDMGFFKTLKIGSKGKAKFTKSAEDVEERGNRLKIFNIKKRRKKKTDFTPLYTGETEEQEGWEDISEKSIRKNHKIDEIDYDEQTLIKNIESGDYVPDSTFINFEDKDLTDKQINNESEKRDSVIDKKQQAREYLGLVEDKSSNAKDKKEKIDYAKYKDYFNDYRIKQVIKGMKGEDLSDNNLSSNESSRQITDNDVITKDTDANSYYESYLKSREVEASLKRQRESSLSEVVENREEEPKKEEKFQTYKEYKNSLKYSNEEKIGDESVQKIRRDINEFVIPKSNGYRSENVAEEIPYKSTSHEMEIDDEISEGAEDDLAALLSKNKKFKMYESEMKYKPNIEAAGSIEATKSVLDDIPSKTQLSREERKKAIRNYKESKSSATDGGFTMMATSKNAEKSEHIEDENEEDDIKVVYSGTYRPYNAPPVTLLNQSKNPVPEIDFVEKCRAIEQTYGDLGVEVQVKGYKRGPSTVKFEVEKPLTVPIAKIKGKEEDLTMRLKAASMIKLETPIPGTDVFGIEVPLMPFEREMVVFRDLIESSEFNTAQGERLFGLGKDINGKENIFDLAKAKHILAAGATGSGKSVFINVLLCSLLYKYSPQELKLILIDPKRVELNLYNGLPHMLFKDSICDANQAIMSLKWLIQEIESRFKLFAKLRVRNITEYNKTFDKKIPYILCVVDELNDLMMASKTEVEKSITKIGQIGRAAGIHLVIATQRPSVDVITGLIKANLPSRIAFKVASMFDSKTIFDNGGAEYLLGNGDLLCKIDGENGVEKRLQCPFISSEEVEAVTTYIANNNVAEFDENILNAIVEEEQGGGDEGGHRSARDSEFDTAFYDVVEHYITTNKKVSVSSIQRTFGFGYPRAGKIVDTMERLGLIDLPDNTNKSGRDIKWSMDEFDEFWDEQNEEKQ